MASFGLATIANEKAELESALVVDSWVYPLAGLDAALGKKRILEYLQNWSESYKALQELASSVQNRNPDDYISQRISLQDAKFDTPIHLPPKLLAVGANYSSHLLEVGLSAEKWDPMPFFSCPPSTTVVGPGKTIQKPADTEQFDWETELTVVIGKPLRNATLEEARAAIAGYTIGLDLSCRDRTKTGPHGLLDIMRGKGQPTMKPVGPIFWPTQSISDNMNDVPVKLWLNDKLMQDGRTSEMVRLPDECLVEISKVTLLEPGDLVMTGTPSGSAISHGGRWLKKGDRIKAQIGPLGILEVEVS